MGRRLRPARSAARLRLAIATVIGLLAGGLEAPRPAAAATWRVPAVYPELAGALARATSGDTVLVGAGRYVGPLRVPSGVACISLAGPDSTILDGGGRGPVVTFERSDASTLLDGFTITGGRLGGRHAMGAGILCRRHAAPRINGNRVTGNVARGEASRGGGIACVDGADAVISNNRIDDNEAAWGGGIYIGKQRGWPSSPVVSGNRIVRNRARRGGGGMAITHASEPLVTANLIAWNVALAAGGGGLHVARAMPRVEENTFWANADSSGQAAAICLVDYAAPTIDHNIIAGHAGAPAIRCVAQRRERQIVRCNDVWNPAGGGFAAGCRVYPGNISVDPGFCDAGAGRFELRPSSPCVAQPGCGALGAYGVGCPESGRADPPSRADGAAPRSAPRHPIIPR